MIEMEIGELGGTVSRWFTRDPFETGGSCDVGAVFK